MADAETIEIIITEAETSPVRLMCNGKFATIPVGKPAILASVFLGPLESANLKFKLIGSAAPVVAAVEAAGEVGSGGDVITAEGEGAGEGVETPTDPNAIDAATFDPEAVIVGNSKDVIARLAGMSAAELEAVRTSEVDREQPRKGVISAIEEALKAFPTA